VSLEFVNAAVAQSIDRTDPVSDVILKTHISGTGRTIATVGAGLIPDDQAAVIDLITIGATTTQTVGINGPVQLYSASTIPFEIRQRVHVRPAGVQAGVPCARAESDSTLTGLTTDFQCLLDGLVKKIACKKYRKNKDKAEDIASRHAEKRLNESAQSEAGPRLQDADRALRDNLADLRARGMALAALRFSTSKDAVLVRADFAGQGAIAAPPELAPRSYLALRVHETMINEYGRADLAGKTYTGEQLENGAKKLGRAEGPIPKDDKDFSITFTKDKPLEATFADHGLRVVIRLAEFTSGENDYSGMDMTVKYKFVTAGEHIKAVRQGPIEAFPPGFKAGQKLSARQQAMRTVLQKRFAKLLKEELVLKDVELSTDLRQAGPLVATRAQADRGWLLVTWRKRLE
jgi:hypothetical protein